MTTTFKFSLKARFTGALLFEAELDAKFEKSSEAVKIGEAVKKAYLGGAYLGGAYLGGAYLGGAYLGGAYLGGAYLGGAYLGGAYLGGADLRGAYLRGADLRGADLRGADLRGADLRGAYLRGADLRGADLRGADLGEDKTLKLLGNRPFFQIGPLGSRADYLTAFLTDAGIYVRAGCFFDTIAKFAEAVKSTHGGTAHELEYKAAIAMIEAHFAVWSAEGKK